MVISALVSSIILAIVQGITEWLPISSSGHLTVIGNFLDYSGGLFFEVALHFGTLMAVFVYFGKDIIDIIRELGSGNWKSENGKLGLMVGVATLPAAIVGFLLEKYFVSSSGSLEIVALGFAVTGIMLLIASLDYKKQGKFSYGKALLVGVAQVFALFPGVSRSGATLSAGLVLGLKEKDALKFSFLMSIPIIFGANLLVVGSRQIPPEFVWATIVSFVVGLITIHLLYNFVLTKKKNLRWFSAYALVLSASIGAWLVFR